MTVNFNNNMSTAAVFLGIEISSFLSQKKFRALVEGEMSAPRDIQAGVPQGSALSPILFSLYIGDTPQTPGVYLGLFADNTCIYATLQRRLCSQKATVRSI
jgi:hypothetical protein